MQLLSRAGNLAASPTGHAVGNRRSRVHLRLLPRPAAIGQERPFVLRVDSLKTGQLLRSMLVSSNL